MKAHTHFSIALLMATCCCFSTFSADSALKTTDSVSGKLDYKKRAKLKREYDALDTQDPSILDRKHKIAVQMKQEYERLQKQGGYDQHAHERKKQMDEWTEKEKKSGDELRKSVIHNLEEMNATVFNTLKNNKDLSPTQKAELYKQQYEIVHKLKELQHTETMANPHNKQAEISEQHYMVQSMLLTQLKETVPQTPNASEPAPTITTQTPMATTSVAAPVTSSSYVNTTADKPAPTTTPVPIEVKTEQQADEQKKDKNCIIL